MFIVKLFQKEEFNMIDTKIQLIGNWFMKVTRGEINDEILLFSTKKSVSFYSIKNSINSIISAVPKQYSTPQPYSKRYNENYTLTESEKKVLEYQHVSAHGYTIYLMDSHNINIIHEIKNYKNKSKNIIIIAANNYLYSDFSRPLLHFHVDSETYEKDNFIHSQDIKNLQHIIETNMQTSIINYTERYKYYLEFFPIVKIIQSNQFNVLENFIFFRLKNIDHDLLLYDTSYHENKFSLNDLIRADIYLLKTYKILTSRLAIIIYRLSFLNLGANKTQIGLFFKKELNVKSTTINLNSLGIEFINEDLSTKNFRGYNLQHPLQTDLTTRIEIAKKLLKAGVDIKIITKATKLQLSQIL